MKTREEITEIQDHLATISDILLTYKINLAWIDDVDKQIKSLESLQLFTGTDQTLKIRNQLEKLARIKFKQSKLLNEYNEYLKLIK
jgi:transcriptional regulator of NAD metabolism